MAGFGGCGCLGRGHGKQAQHVAAPEVAPTKPNEPLNAVFHQAAEERRALRDAARRYFLDAGCPLTEQEEKWMTDEVLGIFVRARETRAERLEIFVRVLRWRMSNHEALMSHVCPYCASNPRSHDARLFGQDSEGDFVFMTCFELPQDISADSITRHMTCLLEGALTEFPISPNAPLADDGHPKTRQWTIVFDLHGFGLRYYDPRTTIKLLELLQEVHRGRLKKVVLLDAPRIFSGFFKMVKPFFKKATIDKLEFCDWKAVQPCFEAKFGTALSDELYAEALENRDAKTVASKVWTTFYGNSLQLARTRKARAPLAEKPYDGPPKILLGRRRASKILADGVQVAPRVAKSIVTLQNRRSARQVLIAFATLVFVCTSASVAAVQFVE